MWPTFCLTTSCKRTLAFVTTFRHVFRKRAAQLHYVGPELRYIFWPPLEARKCSAAQGLHSEVAPRAFWRLVSKSRDECKGSFARGCEAKRWSHWTCSSLGTVFQPMRINSVPDVKCSCNNKNVLRAQSMVWHFVRHPVISVIDMYLNCIQKLYCCTCKLLLHTFPKCNARLQSKFNILFVFC